MKNPIPVFDGMDYNYSSWKKKVKMWQTIAKEQDETKQGTILVLHMSGKALDICLEESDTKVSTIIATLDKIYGDTENLLNQWEEFEDFKRVPSQTMKEFIHMFEQKVTHLKAKSLDIPQVILSSKLLKGANLSAGDEKIARATCDTSVISETKAALLRMAEGLTCQIVPERKNDGMIKVKEEMTNEEITYYNNQRQRGRSSGNGFQSNDMSHNTQHRLCYGCGQSDHWIKDCPDIRFAVEQLRSNPGYDNSQYQGRQYNSSDQRRTYMCTDQSEPASPVVVESIPKAKVKKSEEKSDKKSVKRVPIYFSQCDMEDNALVNETATKAVLDNAAQATVCGEAWYSNYTDLLDTNSLQEITEKSSDTVFVFGSGEVKASKVVTIPAEICGEKIYLRAHVVNADLPMLLSGKVMKGLGMSVDCQSDTVKVRGKSFKLETASSGHYVVPLTNDYHNYFDTYEQQPTPSKLDEFIWTLKDSLQREDVTDDMVKFARVMTSTPGSERDCNRYIHDYDNNAWLTAPMRDDVTWPPDQFYEPEHLCLM